MVSELNCSLNGRMADCEWLLLAIVFTFRLHLMKLVPQCQVALNRLLAGRPLTERSLVCTANL